MILLIMTLPIMISTDYHFPDDAFDNGALIAALCLPFDRIFDRGPFDCGSFVSVHSGCGALIVL